MMLPVVLSEQIVPGSFAFALSYLVDHELDLSARDARFKNDITGASAYDPRVMLKIVLLAYSQGIISSRSIAADRTRNVQFIAISGDSQPSHAHIAKHALKQIRQGMSPSGFISFHLGTAVSRRCGPVRSNLGLLIQ